MNDQTPALTDENEESPLLLSEESATPAAEKQWFVIHCYSGYEKKGGAFHPPAHRDDGHARPHLRCHHPD